MTTTTSPKAKFLKFAGASFAVALVGFAFFVLAASGGYGATQSFLIAFYLLGAFTSISAMLSMASLLDEEPYKWIAAILLVTSGAAALFSFAMID